LVQKRNPSLIAAQTSSWKFCPPPRGTILPGMVRGSPAVQNVIAGELKSEADSESGGPPRLGRQRVSHN